MKQPHRSVHATWSFLLKQRSLAAFCAVNKLHGIKKPVRIITFIVGIREPTIYVTILFAEYKITLSKSDRNSLSGNKKRPLLQKKGNKIINSAKNEIETPLFIFWFLIARWWIFFALEPFGIEPATCGSEKQSWPSHLSQQTNWWNEEND
jgi:hypothetical protein